MQNNLKKIKMFRSLTTTLVLAFITLIVIIILISSCLNIYFRLQTQEEVIDSQQQLIAQKAADSVSNYVLQKFSELESGARLGNLGTASLEEEEVSLEKLLGLDPAFRQLVLLDTQGQQTAKKSRLSSFASSKLTEMLEDSLFQEISREERYISSVYINSSTSEPLIIITIPIKDIFDDFKGVLIAELNLKFMWNLVDSIKVGETGVAYVVDKDGDLIAFGDTSRVLKGENLLHLYEVSEFVGGDESNCEGKSEISKGILGSDVVTTHVHLSNPDWAVVVELPVDEAYEDVNQELRLSALVIFLCIILATIFSIYLLKRITKPIITLRDATNKIGEGNLDVNIKISGNNEISQLANDFQQMTNRLKKSRQELLESKADLEKKVQERTKELREKSDHLEMMNLDLKSINQELTEAHEELEKTKEKIERQNKKLKKLDQLKSAFLNITSHELRTPMSSIKGYVQMMLKRVLGEIDEEQKNALEIVLRNTNRLDNLIQDILDISRLESGTMKFITDKINVNEMISEVAETMKSSAELKDIKINIETDDSLPIIIIDQDRIKQVIINFMNNAIKFSSDASIINIRAKKDEKNIVFEVQDYGRGIPENKQEKVFETFYQVDSGMDRKFGGAGLGLAISRGIVLSHGGDIWVESTGRPGEGSKFKFTLPIISEIDLEKRFKEIDVFGLEKSNKKDEEK